MKDLASVVEFVESVKLVSAEKSVVVKLVPAEKSVVVKLIPIEEPIAVKLGPIEPVIKRQHAQRIIILKEKTGASRRLRHARFVPGIVYGGNKEPLAIQLDHNALYHALRKEAFHSFPC